MAIRITDAEGIVWTHTNSGQDHQNFCLWGYSSEEFAGCSSGRDARYVGTVAIEKISTEISGDLSFGDIPIDIGGGVESTVQGLTVEAGRWAGGISLIPYTDYSRFVSVVLKGLMKDIDSAIDHRN